MIRTTDELDPISHPKSAPPRAGTRNGRSHGGNPSLGGVLGRESLICKFLCRACPCEFLLGLKFANKAADPQREDGAPIKEENAGDLPIIPEEEKACAPVARTNATQVACIIFVNAIFPYAFRGGAALKFPPAGLVAGKHVLLSGEGICIRSRDALRP